LPVPVVPENRDEYVLISSHKIRTILKAKEDYTGQRNWHFNHEKGGMQAQVQGPSFLKHKKERIIELDYDYIDNN
jgi:hypothetical protein